MNGTKLTIDTRGKIEALDKLAKILGMIGSDAPGAVNIGNVNVVNQAPPSNALEDLRRLAFAIERVAQERASIAQIEGPKGSTFVEGTVEPTKPPAD
jgi:hypothetical protein